MQIKNNKINFFLTLSFFILILLTKQYIWSKYFFIKKQFQIIINCFKSENNSVFQN